MGVGIIIIIVVVTVKGSKDVPLFCVAKGMKSTPKLKL
jgi:hypothetical protein